MYPSLTQTIKEQVTDIKSLQHLKQERSQEMVEVRLANLLITISRQSNFWRKYLKKYNVNLSAHSSLQEIQKLPVVDKKTIQSWNNAHFIRKKTSSAYITYYTSGTTGNPLNILTNDAEAVRNELAYFFEADAFRERDTISLLKKKFILALGRDVTGKYKSFTEYFPLDAFSSLSNKKTRIQLYKKIKEYDSKCIFAYASVLVELMKYVEDDGVSFHYILNPTGESISSIEEKMLYKMTGIPPTFSYTSKEAGRIGVKCTHNIGTNLYHIYRERAFIEILNEDNLPVADGEEGNVVITVLDRIATPIIRYKTGDTGTLLTKTCVCDRESSLLALHGRASEKIVLPNNKYYSALLFRSIFLEQIGLKNIAVFQIEQKSLSELNIYVILRNVVSEEKLRVVEKFLESTLNKHLRVLISPVQHIENRTVGKSKVFIPLLER